MKNRKDHINKLVSTINARIEELLYETELLTIPKMIKTFKQELSKTIREYKEIEPRGEK